MKHLAYLGILAVLQLSCSDNSEKRFLKIQEDHSGISFRNDLTESVEFNIFNYMYFYNGGGVAVGDLNGDELPDIYLAGNQVSNKLYLNRGDFAFEDITEQSHASGFSGWATGVTMADVNADGRLDIYVSYLGDYLIYKGRNQLLINEGNDENGVPKFSERAMEFGLDLVGFSTQAAFFDYDKDGDLDMFMLNHSVHNNGTFGKATLRKVHHPLSGDRLLKNENGRFVEVTAESGIYSSVLGYGLGLSICDFDLDGWPDIYVGNDFHENDYLYRNNHNGTFSEVLQEKFMHTSRYTMGVDWADFNNDLLPDLIAMDMLPEDPEKLKRSAAEDAYDIYDFKINYGYNHQFARNTLQMNNGNGTFSEIALFAGVAASDWSWSTFFADLDLDGLKDILISNGIARRSNDLDYINFVTVDSVQMKMKYDMSSRELEYIAKMPEVKIPNYAFANNGDLTFTNRTAEWGLDEPSFSHGTVYADFDNDGDLDLVMNNVNDKASLYRNQTMEMAAESGPRFLQFVFDGSPGNRLGIGTKVFLYSGKFKQLQELSPVKGFQSSFDYSLTFGVGTSSKIDSAIIVWPDDKYEVIQSLETNKRLRVSYGNARGKFNYEKLQTKGHIFEMINSPVKFKHEENKFVEFNREALIPHMFSREGPAVAMGDINGDGLDDMFIGNGKWKQSRIFIQNTDGSFVRIDQPEIANDSVAEDVSAAFFDADADKDLDLLVVSGGNEFSGKSVNTQPRLYLNDGAGHYTRSDGLPELFMTGSCVAVHDIEGDGDIDVFIGARTTPWHYGIKPDSYLLVNDGTGKYKDETRTLAPAFRKLGFVKYATWADMDGDNQWDLVVASEWDPVRIFYNKNGRLEESGEESGLERARGWWNTLEAVDLDKDGDMDLIAGNMGLNSKLRATVEEPVRMYVSDFDGNDSTDQILTHYIHGKEYTFHTRDELTRQLPHLKKKYLSYQKFSEASIEEMFGHDALEKADKFEATNFSSAYIENVGSGKFVIHNLPAPAQFSTINAILVEDFNDDAHLDLFIAGNYYPINIQLGRNDAMYGLLLVGNGQGKFESIVDTGVILKGEVRALRGVRIVGDPVYMAFMNNDSIKTFREIRYK